MHGWIIGGTILYFFESVKVADWSMVLCQYSPVLMLGDKEIIPRHQNHWNH